MNFKILEKLIYPMSVEKFFDEYWEKKVLYIPRDDINYYEDILSMNDVNEYLSNTDIRYPHVRLVKEGKEIPLQEYSYNFTYGENAFQGVIDMDKLFVLYNQGATMSFQLLQKSIKKLRDFANSIEQELKFPTQSNLFLTPPNSQGFTAHYDTHSFFIIHLNGYKQWNIFDDNKVLPLVTERIFDEDVEITSKPIMQPVLSPGDFMYVPRGIYHEAMSNDTTTLQITLGIFPKVWTEVMQEALNEITDLDPEFRKAPNPLELANSEQSILEHFELLCKRLREKAKPYQYFEDAKSKTFSRQVHDTTNRLEDLLNIENLNIDTVIKKRNIQTTFLRKEDEIIFKFYDKEFHFPTFVTDEIEFLHNVKKPFKVKEIIGDLDDNSKLSLVKKFLVEGILTLD